MRVSSALLGCAGDPAPVKGDGAHWSFTKHRLAKFNGVKRNFELHLKEREWRSNRPLSQLQTELKRLAAKNKDLTV
jgi:transposase